jgi:hypothetical protein
MKYRERAFSPNALELANAWRNKAWLGQESPPSDIAALVDDPPRAVLDGEIMTAAVWRGVGIEFLFEAVRLPRLIIL